MTSQDLAAAQEAIATMEGHALELWRQLDAQLAEVGATVEALNGINRESGLIQATDRASIARRWSSKRADFWPGVAAFALSLRKQLPPAEA